MSPRLGSRGGVVRKHGGSGALLGHGPMMCTGRGGGGWGGRQAADHSAQHPHFLQHMGGARGGGFKKSVRDGTQGRSRSSPNPAPSIHSLRQIYIGTRAVHLNGGGRLSPQPRPQPRPHPPPRPVLGHCRRRRPPAAAGYTPPIYLRQHAGGSQTPDPPCVGLGVCRSHAVPSLREHTPDF